MVGASSLVLIGIIVFGTLYAVAAAIYYFLKFTFCSKPPTTLPIVTPEVQTDVEGTFKALNAKTVY